MAFPQDQNNLSDNPVPLSGSHTTAWASRVIAWIRSSLVPAIQSLVGPIQTATTNASTALTTAQGRMSRDFSNITRNTTAMRNLVNNGSQITGDKTNWLLAMEAGHTRIKLVNPDTTGGGGTNFNSIITYSTVIRAYHTRAIQQLGIGSPQGAVTINYVNDIVGMRDHLHVLSLLPTSAVVVGAQESNWTGPGSVGTIKQYRIKYRTYTS